MYRLQLHRRLQAYRRARCLVPGQQAVTAFTQGGAHALPSEEIPTGKIGNASRTPRASSRAMIHVGTNSPRKSASADMPTPLKQPRVIGPSLPGFIAASGPTPL